VEAVLVSPVRVFTTLTVTPGITAPEGSVTVPRIVPVTAWANRATADNSNHNTLFTNCVGPSFRHPYFNVLSIRRKACSKRLNAGSVSTW
jgi:hypothetical protein